MSDVHSIVDFRAIRRILSRHLLLILVIVTIGVVFVYAGWFAITKHPASFFSHVVAGIVAVVFVTFLIERPLTSHVHTLNHFRVRRFCKEVALADSKVAILDIWLRWILDQQRSEMFRSAVLSAVRNGVEIRILVAAPDSEVARDRAAQLQRNAPEFRDRTVEEIVRMMERAIDRLRTLQDLVRQTLDDETNPASRAECPLEIRLCRLGPKLSMYKVDETAYWSHYLHQRLSTEGLQYRTTTDLGPAEYLGQHFLDLWDDEDTRPLL